MVIQGARVYSQNHKFEEKTITIKDRRITEDTCGEPAGTILDASGLFAIPGLVDMHLHGAAGYDFCTADSEGLETIAEYEAMHGVAAICPTTMTLPVEELEKIAERISAFQKSSSEEKNGIGADVVGIRLEGPFLNEKKAGAQNIAHLQQPNVEAAEHLQTCCDGLIRVVDVAPELTGGMELIQKLGSKVRISVGHTDADYDTSLKAFEAGAGQLTHCFNAMNGIHHRMPGPMIAAMEAGASAELIADGIHVHPAMVRFAFRSFGADKVILISDSMEATGLPDGTYALGGQAVKVQGSRAELAEAPDTIAGSVTNLFDCLKCAVLEMAIPLEDAVRAAAENPAKALGIDKDYGSLEQGHLANIILVNENLEIKMILKEGEVIRH